MDIYSDSTIKLIQLEGVFIGFVLGFVVFWLPPQLKKAIKKYKQSQLGKTPN
jgi:hypothetical protein